MITQQKKREIVANLIEKFKASDSYYLVDFKGMSVKQSELLRKELRDGNTKLMVAKNTLLLRAMNEVGDINLPEELFVGPTAIAFCGDDPLAPAKVLKTFIEKNKVAEFKGALVEGQFFDGSKLKELSVLPSKPEMIASIIGSLHAPISGIVGSINAVLRDVAYLVEEVAKKQAENN